MENAIVVNGLRKNYKDLAVIKGISFTVPKGKVFGLLGANGAGKSTTSECILGTKKPDAGEITILGMDPIKERRALFERVGVQFQESHYQERITVEEICEVTASFYKEALPYEKLLKEFGLKEKKKALVKELSGGLKQKLFIVLALIPKPEVVFLDELTTGLDSRARREVWSYLKNLKKQGMTIFLTSHFMDEVEALCDEIAILKEGQFIFRGTVEEAKIESHCEHFEDAYLWFTKEEREDEDL